MSPPGMRETWSPAFSLWQSSARDIVTAFQQPGDTATVCCNVSALVIVPSPWKIPDTKKKTQVLEKGLSRSSDYNKPLVLLNFITWWHHYVDPGEDSPAEVLVFSPSACSPLTYPEEDDAQPPPVIRLSFQTVTFGLVCLKTGVTVNSLLSIH